MVKFCIFFLDHTQALKPFPVFWWYRWQGWTRFENWKKKKNCACIKGTKKYYGWCSPWNLFNSFFITLREHFVTKHITDHKQQYSCERGKTTELRWWWRWWWWWRSENNRNVVMVVLKALCEPFPRKWQRFRFEHPFTSMIAGITGSGKTAWVIDL